MRKNFSQSEMCDTWETPELDLFNHDMSDPLPSSSLACGNYSMLMRAQLDQTVWIDFFPQWLKNSSEFFRDILANTPWRIQQRVMYDREIATPRLLYGYRLNHAQTPPAIQYIGSNLSQYYGKTKHPPFASAGLCLYRDGDDSVAWHGDSVKRLMGKGTIYSKFPQALVAILSLGATRTLLLRPKSGGSSRKFTLHSGDLLVMGGTCQSTWEHCIPKTSQHMEARISIQFRPHGVH